MLTAVRGCQNHLASKLGSIEMWIPSVQIRHNHNRPNLQRPLPYHWKKVRLLKLVEPRYPPKIPVCQKLQEPNLRFLKNRIDFEVNGYARFLARDLFQKFETYPMVAFFHKNSFTETEFLKIRGMLYDAEFPILMKYNQINMQIYTRALGGTKYEPILQLIDPVSSAVGFCQEPDVPRLLKLLKKMPQFILIGMLIEDRLLHRADIDELGKLPDLTALRSRLSHTLTLAASNLSNNLQANQLQLSRNLALHSAGDATKSA